MGSYVSPEHHPALEEYCETIYELAEDDVRVIQARIAERLGVSRPAVSEMVRRLEVEGLITIEKGTISLSDKGHSLATTMVRRHRLAERFLTDILGLSWATAHHEAGKWEHVISPEVEAALLAHLGEPTTCPHGNPIPGSDYIATSMTPLAELPVGTDFSVRRIPEELEFADGMLEFLERSHITPGVTGRVVGMSPDGTTTIDIDGQVVGLGPFASERILVAI